MFITFEGGEGAGKSTQVGLLQQHLTTRQLVPAISTKEPGGTSLADKIRNLILSGTGIDDPLLEYALLAAARRDHVKRVIQPALQSGKWVICDRFFDSSLVYQGFAKNLDQQIMKQQHMLLSEGLQPDLTFVLDIPPSVGQNRISGRLGNTHYDKRPLAFHTIVHDGFLKLAEENPGRIVVINGDDKTGKVFDKVLEEINARGLIPSSIKSA